MAAMFYYSANGYFCHVSPGDSSEVDLLIEKDGIFTKIQVKTACGKTDRLGGYQVRLLSFGSRKKGAVPKKISACSFDKLFVLTESWDVFEFTKDEIGERQSIALMGAETSVNHRCRLLNFKSPTIEESVQATKERLSTKKPTVRKRKFDITPDELRKLLEDNNYNFCKVGRLLKVSDNAVRKRAKFEGIV